MSVEKMNYYKEQKSHRKENLAKEKRKKKALRATGYGVGALVVVGLCAAIGLTGYNAYKANEAAKPDYSVSSLVLDDVAGILTEDAAVPVEEIDENEEAVEEVSETEAAPAAEEEQETEAP